jgi:hypothetical protein
MLAFATGAHGAATLMKSLFGHASGQQHRPDISGYRTAEDEVTTAG